MLLSGAASGSFAAARLRRSARKCAAVSKCLLGAKLPLVRPGPQMGPPTSPERKLGALGKHRAPVRDRWPPVGLVALIGPPARRRPDDLADDLAALAGAR